MPIIMLEGPVFLRLEDVEAEKLQRAYMSALMGMIPRQVIEGRRRKRGKMLHCALHGYLGRARAFAEDLGTDRGHLDSVETLIFGKPLLPYRDMQLRAFRDVRRPGKNRDGESINAYRRKA